jgi:hypothetical protein
VRKPFFVSVLAYTSAVLALGGVAFFCVSRMGYEIYYQHYGVSPETIGLASEGLIAHEASALNVALLVLICIFALRGGWMLNNSHWDTDRLAEEVGRVKSERDVVMHSIAAGAIVDVDAARRNVVYLNGEVSSLEGRQELACQNDALRRSRGLRWFGVAITVFGLWTASVIAEASASGPAPRSAEWFDPLQVSVLRVRSMAAVTSGASGIGLWRVHDGGNLLLLGASSGTWILYSVPHGTLEMIPQASVVLVAS